MLMKMQVVILLGVCAGEEIVFVSAHRQAGSGERRD
jgi:hypothetical protein